ncbi:protein of unknown function [Cyanobium sp. NIES-981]|nr:protein of unknown function [Cyanobium sp. NIES-981]
MLHVAPSINSIFACPHEDRRAIK